MKAFTFHMNIQCSSRENVSCNVTSTTISTVETKNLCVKYLYPGANQTTGKHNKGPVGN